MVIDKTGNRSRLCPSARILELAQHKDSKTEWVTTPCRKLTWGNQESIWPLSYAALCAVPTERTLRLAKPKRHFSVWDEQSSQEDRPNSRNRSGSASRIQYEDLVRLSTPKHRSRSPQEARPPHEVWCDRSCPIWHVDTKALTRPVSPRLVQLAGPKQIHPNFRGNRESVETHVSDAAKTARTTPRLDLLSLPKMRENSSLFYQLGYPDEPIRPVSRSARRAMASARVKSLAVPKGVVKDYVPQRDPVWSPSRRLRTAEAQGRIES
ncbi:hypothetical protein AGOR_G00182990 [Albula goreensis]|uniref:Testicular haploid expressed gene protein-like n=1 Tax=Albula goreensis TaxID=1534307 RepID=A0A8T3CWX9_9TELE|nr:hypothetical protein AGOR_G00182990 [Albula goreensis]